MKQIKPLFLIMIILASISRASFAQQPACDYKVEILVDGNEFQKKGFKWRVRATKIEGSPTNITGTAEIKKLNGTSVKSYKPWNLDPISMQKTSGEYTPNLKEGEEYEIISRIYVGCDDTNMGNNMDIKKIKIKGEKKEEWNEEGAKSGNNGSEMTKYKGLEETKARQESTPKISGRSEITGNAVHSTNKIVYESSNEKAKGLIVILLLALSILLNIVLIWRR